MNLKPIQQLLETEMDRKEFLMYVGASVLAVTGVTSILKTLNEQPVSRRKDPVSSGGGYGSSPYGG